MTAAVRLTAASHLVDFLMVVRYPIGRLANLTAAERGLAQDGALGGRISAISALKCTIGSSGDEFGDAGGAPLD